MSAKDGSKYFIDQETQICHYERSLSRFPVILRGNKGEHGGEGVFIKERES